ncbi:uncharacterized protein LOC132738688 [Ruditapes philippinarum]|uniref:uncharacterized protein LOC132738688 n=1 Tax=Ruditapes philippinarum TaxID=129788 RepID=UPI00295A9D8E|nr:uncharacterized protein LOC132738688 [Ruditapes philippinarum]
MVEMQTVPVDLCYSQPTFYRLCGKNKCIPWRQKCPCNELSEFQCTLGNCIPLELKCDGLRHCLYGDDEENCYMDNKTEATEKRISATTESYDKVKSVTEDGLSAPLVVIIASVCVFVCILMVFLLYLFLARRQKNNTSRESQSATQPLRKSYITSDSEAVSLAIPAKHCSNEKTYTARKPGATDYLPVSVQNDQAEYQIDNHVIHYDDESKYSSAKHTQHEYNKRGRTNLAINPGAEIYTIDPSNESKVSGLGKYTFKPRLKYLKSKPYDEIDEKDREKLYVINSYKHCSGKSIVPETLTFDKDPQKFSDTFATDLLCSSTPRQPVRHSMQNNLRNSLESIASLSDVEIT